MAYINTVCIHVHQGNSVRSTVVMYPAGVETLCADIGLHPRQLADLPRLVDVLSDTFNEANCIRWRIWQMYTWMAAAAAYQDLKLVRYL